MSTTTDVREWAKTQPDLAGQVPDRGPLPRTLRDAYDQAHPAPEPEPAYDAGVTEADFPAEPPAEPAQPEQRPRPVRAQATRSRLKNRLWGSSQGTDGKPKKKPPRISLTSFVEEAWADLAWLAAPVPPLRRVLDAQAPYAGVVLEDAVKGTIVDTVLQPVAKAEGAIRAVNGLMGPPVFVMGILTRGQRVKLVDEDGKPVLDGTGQPATDYDTPTKMMFMGLRYCLLQMTKVSAGQLRAVQERSEDRVQRGREVDKMIAWIFGMPEPAEEQVSAEEEAIRRAQQMMGGDGAGS